MALAKVGEGSLTLMPRTPRVGPHLEGTLSWADNCLPTTGPIAVGGVLDLGGNTQSTSGLISIQGGTVQNGTLVKSGTQDFDAQSGTVSATFRATSG